MANESKHRSYTTGTIYFSFKANGALSTPIPRTMIYDHYMLTDKNIIPR